jgi:excisionase family DNA binding protein
MSRNRGRSGDEVRLERYLTVDDLADVWQVSTRHVRRMIAKKRIQVSRIGRNVRIHPKIAKLDPGDKI